MDRSLARRTWQLLEPYHAVVYFDPKAKAIYESIGLKGYWMGYFASRSAAMGATVPEVVVATFYNFHPRMVHRALPDAWRFSTPEAVLEARYQLAHTALDRALAGKLGSREIVGAAEIAREIALGCRPEGRPLYAAHAALPWPSEPHLILWHAATLWREFRGDGHVAALTVHGIDGCEAHVLAAAAGVLPERQRDYRGWSDEEWLDAETRLRRRDLLDERGVLTQQGQALHEEIEGLTDALSLSPMAAVGEEPVQTLHSALQAVFEQIAQANGVPYPNAMGLTAPESIGVRAHQRPAAPPDVTSSSDLR
ncbi:MAG: hypothetical protein M3N53_00275 [Actinomycetota bacterium]|nr:hypothetical protein [Actinomycetota bacterium]